MIRESKMLAALVLLSSFVIFWLMFSCSNQAHEDYYAVGRLNWQNEGCYQSRAPALYINIDQCVGTVNSHYFTLAQVRSGNFSNVEVDKDYTYSDVFNTNSRDDLTTGDMVVCKFEYYPPAHRYTVTEIQKLDSVQNGDVWA